MICFDTIPLDPIRQIVLQDRFIIRRGSFASQTLSWKPCNPKNKYGAILIFFGLNELGKVVELFINGSPVFDLNFESV